MSCLVTFSLRLLPGKTRHTIYFIVQVFYIHNAFLFFLTSTLVMSHASLMHTLSFKRYYTYFTVSSCISWWALTRVVAGFVVNTHSIVKTRSMTTCIQVWKCIFFDVYPKLRQERQHTYWNLLPSQLRLFLLNAPVSWNFKSR